MTIAALGLLALVVATAVGFAAYKSTGSADVIVNKKDFRRRASKGRR